MDGNGAGASGRERPRCSDFVMTILQPPELDDEAFDRELVR